MEEKLKKLVAEVETNRPYMKCYHAFKCSGGVWLFDQQITMDGVILVSAYNFGNTMEEALDNYLNGVIVDRKTELNWVRGLP